jgi:hypothetical protein
MSGISLDVISNEPSKTNMWNSRHGHMSEHAWYDRVDQERITRWLQLE